MPGIFYCRTSTIFKFEYVSVVFVRKELKLLKRKKSTGLDNLLPRLLKDCADELLDRYVILLTYLKTYQLYQLYGETGKDNADS